jgi:hypothetical protein
MNTALLENHGGGVFKSGRKRAWEPKIASKHLRRREQTEGGLEKWLANLLSGRKITKKAHANRGQETKWEISVSIVSDLPKSDSACQCLKIIRRFG